MADILTRAVRQTRRFYDICMQIMTEWMVWGLLSYFMDFGKVVVFLVRLWLRREAMNLLAGVEENFVSMWEYFLEMIA